MNWSYQHHPATSAAVVLDAADREIAQVFGDTPEDITDRARLIAQAPELLRALRDLVCIYQYSTQQNIVDQGRRWREAIDLVMDITEDD